MRKPEPQMTQIIRDVRDGRRDYYLPIKQARALFNEGKLCKVECYSDRWTYCHHKPTDARFFA